MQRKNLNLYFALSRSKIFLALLTFITLLSIFVVVDLSIKIWLRCLIGLLVILYTIFILWQQGFLYKRQSIVALSYTNNHEWLLVTHAGKKIKAKLKGGSLVTPITCVLHFNLIDYPFYYSRKNMVIFCDALTKNDFRRLRVALLHIV